MTTGLMNEWMYNMNFQSFFIANGKFKIHSKHWGIFAFLNDITRLFQWLIFKSKSSEFFNLHILSIADDQSDWKNKR